MQKVLPQWQTTKKSHIYELAAMADDPKQTDNSQ
jgi:hypothetical protein